MSRTFRLHAGLVAAILRTIVLVLAAVCVQHQLTAGQALRVITRAKDVRELPAAEARRQYPVKLRAVVTYVDSGGGQELFVQDESSGIFVFLKYSTTDAPLKAGQLVDVLGVTTAGDFSPCVTGAKIHVLGTGQLPKPVHPPMGSNAGAEEDGQWAEIEGVARSGQVKDDRLFLNVATSGGNYVAIMVDYPRDWASILIDARISLRGALAALFNERRQAFGVRIFVPKGSLRVINAAPSDPFTLPVSPLGSVGQFRPGEDMERRIHVRGIVSGVEPGADIYLSDGLENLEIQSFPACTVVAGDLVDIVGFPSTIGARAGLRDALCVRVSVNSKLAAAAVSAEDVLPQQVATDSSGYGLAAGMRYDMRLVRIEGTLLHSASAPEGYAFVLDGGKRQFTATLPSPGSRSRVKFEEGSTFQLTGVCLVTYDQYRRAQSFRILLRHPDDIEVLSRPPWWNLAHALWGMGITLVCFLATVSWVWVLRTRVAKQTLQLRQANDSLLLLSARDGLTGAANRRKFDETLEAEFTRSRRSKTCLSLVMLDIDFFKALNDTYGHQRGDECLVQVVHALRSLPLRTTDLVARYGGEEFAVLLPGAEHQGALNIAERLRKAIFDLAIPNAGSAVYQSLSVSLGVATIWPSVDTRAASLIASADMALYRSKARGRNCVSSLEVNEPALENA